MLRFAKSPAEDMNISDLRVAIFNFIVSKQKNEELLIRIDDTDKKNDTEGKEKEILELLSLFSIDSSRVISQSENLKYHQKLAMQLMAQKKAFACFCSSEKIEELKQKAKNKGKVYSYDDFCSTLSDETVLNCNAPFVVRSKKPKEDIKFTDSLNGNFKLKPFEIDAFIILDHEKKPTYNYACAIDDMLYDISLVIREDKHINNTARQIKVREDLNYKKNIEYAHIQQIDTTITVKNLIDEGFLPSAIANYLVLISFNTPCEIFTLEEALKWFDIKNLKQEKIKFDIKELKLINKKHLEKIDNLRLSKILGFADEDIGKLAKLFLQEANTIKELNQKVDQIFSVKTPLNGFEKEFNQLKNTLKNAGFFNNFNDLQTYLSKNLQIEEKTLFTLIKYIFLGSVTGPNISDIYPLIKNYIGEIIK